MVCLLKPVPSGFEDNRHAEAIGFRRHDHALATVFVIVHSPARLAVWANAGTASNSAANSTANNFFMISSPFFNLISERACARNAFVMLPLRRARGCRASAQGRSRSHIRRLRRVTPAIPPPSGSGQRPSFPPRSRYRAAWSSPAGSTCRCFPRFPAPPARVPG